jgi:predicted transcriptional regulator
LKKPKKPLNTQPRGGGKCKVKLNKTDEKVIAALKESGELALQEISDKTGETSKKVFKSLRKLFEHELIETKARKYKLLEKTA